MALRPPGWINKLLHLRLAVRAGQVTGSTATMARQVRALLGDEMPTETVLTQYTRIADLEWPADDGCDKTTPRACAEIGSCYTLAQAAEAMLDYQRRKQLLGRLSVGQYDALRAAAVDATGLDLPGGSVAESLDTRAAKRPTAKLPEPEDDGAPAELVDGVPQLPPRGDPAGKQQRNRDILNTILRRVAAGEVLADVLESDRSYAPVHGRHRQHNQVYRNALTQAAAMGAARAGKSVLAHNQKPYFHEQPEAAMPAAPSMPRTGNETPRIAAMLDRMDRSLALVAAGTRNNTEIEVALKLANNTISTWRTKNVEYREAIDKAREIGRTQPVATGSDKTPAKTDTPAQDVVQPDNVPSPQTVQEFQQDAQRMSDNFRAMTDDSAALPDQDEPFPPFGGDEAEPLNPLAEVRAFGEAVGRIGAAVREAARPDAETPEAAKARRRAACLLPAEPAPVFGVGDPVPGVIGMVGADALKASGGVKLIGLDIDPVPVEDNPVPDTPRPTGTAAFIRDKIISEVRAAASSAHPPGELIQLSDRLCLLVELLDEAEGI